MPADINLLIGGDRLVPRLWQFRDYQRRGLAPHQVLLVSGIGQAAKTPHYLKANVFNGLHGRGLPVAIGAKLANPELTVIAESGDGCMYGEGGNHFLAALRRNLNLTILVHDNRVYGLTKGQASPTSEQGLGEESISLFVSALSEGENVGVRLMV